MREARRATAKHQPALIVTGFLDHDVANTAFELGAKYLVKPVATVHIESFFRHAVGETARVTNAVADWSVRFGLSEAESEIFFLAAEGHDREAIATIRCVSSLTIKRHIHNLLQKTGDRSLTEAIACLLREALRG